MNESWVLIDETNGATTVNGQVVTPNVLELIAEIAEKQLNQDYSTEYGGIYSVRAGKSVTDIRMGERVFSLRGKLPEAPDAIAYHDISGAGVPYAMIGISECDTMLGIGNSVSIAITHELLETAGNVGCNKFADDLKGMLHAIEMCDGFETQSYPISSDSGIKVYVSNFALEAWFTPHAPAPYSFMSKHMITGFVEAGGALLTAEGQGGNYQIVETSNSNTETQVMGMRRQKHMIGNPSNPKRVMHWSSRVSRIMNAH